MLGSGSLQSLPHVTRGWGRTDKPSGAQGAGSRGWWGKGLTGSLLSYAGDWVGVLGVVGAEQINPLQGHSPGLQGTGTTDWETRR